VSRSKIIAVAALVGIAAICIGMVASPPATTALASSSFAPTNDPIPLPYVNLLINGSLNSDCSLGSNVTCRLPGGNQSSVRVPVPKVIGVKPDFVLVGTPMIFAVHWDNGSFGANNFGPSYAIDYVGSVKYRFSGLRSYVVLSSLPLSGNFQGPAPSEKPVSPTSDALVEPYDLHNVSINTDNAFIYRLNEETWKADYSNMPVPMLYADNKDAYGDITLYGPDQAPELATITEEEPESITDLYYNFETNTDAYVVGFWSPFSSFTGGETYEGENAFALRSTSRWFAYTRVLWTKLEWEERVWESHVLGTYPTRWVCLQAANGCDCELNTSTWEWERVCWGWETYWHDVTGGEDSGWRYVGLVEKNGIVDIRLGNSTQQTIPFSVFQSQPLLERVH